MATYQETLNKNGRPWRRYEIVRQSREHLLSFNPVEEDLLGVSQGDAWGCYTATGTGITIERIKSHFVWYASLSWAGAEAGQGRARLRKEAIAAALDALELHHASLDELPHNNGQLPGWHLSLQEYKPLASVYSDGFEEIASTYFEPNELALAKEVSRKFITGQDWDAVYTENKVKSLCHSSFIFVSPNTDIL